MGNIIQYNNIYHIFYNWENIIAEKNKKQTVYFTGEINDL
jgi:hypothetical protein